ncbi:SAM-dependent methyltransferase, partial [Escherichia coli]|nr:SAM-dependent methyltransferase [Escherichia coli]
MSELPAQLRGVVVGNEVLDAMPVKLLAWDGAQWLERGVTRAASGPMGKGSAAPTADAPPGTATAAWEWSDR